MVIYGTSLWYVRLMAGQNSGAWNRNSKWCQNLAKDENNENFSAFSLNELYFCEYFVLDGTHERRKESF